MHSLLLSDAAGWGNAVKATELLVEASPGREETQQKEPGKEIKAGDWPR